MRQIALLDFTYFTNFGSQIAVLSVLPTWFEQTFGLNAVVASVVAAAYPVLNLVSRPSGGLGSVIKTLDQKYCADGWGAYERHLAAEKHEISKKKTPRIEQKHLRLRTRIKRLARKTICFSKSEKMHDLVIGLFINCYEFGLNV